MTQEETTQHTGAASPQGTAEVRPAREEAGGLKAQLRERDARLGSLQAELEEAATAGRAAQEELASTKAALEERDADLAAATETLREAVASYRASLITANPEIPADMIAGATVGDIDASVEKARELVGRVRSTIEEDLRATSVPAGAPERSAPDVSSLSPREKIEHAIRKEA